MSGYCDILQKLSFDVKWGSENIPKQAKISQNSLLSPLQTHKYPQYPQSCDFIVHHIYTSMRNDFGVSSLYFGRVTIVLSLHLSRGQDSYEWSKRTD